MMLSLLVLAITDAPHHRPFFAENIGTLRSALLVLMSSLEHPATQKRAFKSITQIAEHYNEGVIEDIFTSNQTK
jgi:hypothetical protein